MKVTLRNEGKSVPATTSLSADPFRGISTVQEAMNRLFNDSFFSPFFGDSRFSREESMKVTPRVDISETEKEIKIRMDVPGLKKEDLNVEVTENMIALSGVVNKTEEEKGENFYRMERGYGSFSREFVLPSKIETKSVDAKLKDGTLKVTLKKQPSEQRQKILIKGG